MFFKQARGLFHVFVFEVECSHDGQHTKAPHGNTGKKNHPTVCLQYAFTHIWAYSSSQVNVKSKL